MGASFGDLDNDGWLDIYLGTGTSELEALLPNRMFRNDGGKKFQDVTTSGGFGHLQKGHSVAFGDIDNDGDEDIFEEIGGALPGDTYQSVLFENPGHGGHWITLELQGVTTNRAGVWGAHRRDRADSGGAAAHLPHRGIRVELRRQSDSAAHRAGRCDGGHADRGVRGRRRRRCSGLRMSGWMRRIA